MTPEEIRQQAISLADRIYWVRLTWPGTGTIVEWLEEFAAFLLSGGADSSQLVSILKRGTVTHGYYGFDEHGRLAEMFFATDEAKLNQIVSGMKLRFILPDLTLEEVRFLIALRDSKAADSGTPAEATSRKREIFDVAFAGATPPEASQQPAPKGDK